MKQLHKCLLNNNNLTPFSVEYIIVEGFDWIWIDWIFIFHNLSVFDSKDR